MRILIRDCRLIDPANGVDERTSVLVADGLVAQIGGNAAAEVVIDGGGLWAVPGFIDLHTHLREPGFEYKETVATGTRAAVAGGFTSVCAMPNTSPVTDSPELVSRLLERPASANILPVGCLTQGQHGERPADIAGMAAAGAVAFSDDGKSVANAHVMRECLKLLAAVNKPVFSHCEDISLVNGGVAGEIAAKRLGLPANPGSSEHTIVARDILLAAETGARLHVCHMSTAVSVQLLREAKARGESVTGEVTPHHFSLTEHDIKADDAAFKMNPPLRGPADVDAILSGLADGTIDAIATDHAPHGAAEKNCGFKRAANGIPGLETAFALGLTKLVARGVLSEAGLLAKLTCNPAGIIGSERGNLAVGRVADIAIIDPLAEWTVEPKGFYTLDKATPFAGMKLRGRVMYTIVGGELAFGRN